MLSKSQRDELRQRIKYSMEVHGEYFESPIESSTLGELLDAADELAEIKRLPVVEHLRNTIQMQEAELRHLREYNEKIAEADVRRQAELDQANDKVERYHSALSYIAEGGRDGPSHDEKMMWLRARQEIGDNDG